MSDKIVRCKNCDRWDQETNKCMVMDTWTKPEWYCCNGQIDREKERCYNNDKVDNK